MRCTEISELKSATLRSHNEVNVPPACSPFTRVPQGLFLPLVQLMWCFSMVGMFGCWGCAAGAAGVGATTQLTYRIAQYDANWFPLGVALWSVVLIMGSEAAFLWEFQAAWRSAFTFLAALATLYYLYKSVRVHSLVLYALWGVACERCQ